MNDEIAKEILTELRYIKQLLLYANPPPQMQGPNGKTVMMTTPHPEMSRVWSSIFPTEALVGRDNREPAQLDDE